VENLAPPGVDLQTIQPIGSRYTDYATKPNNERYVTPQKREEIYTVTET
jgi:hypothetical protein